MEVIEGLTRCPNSIGHELDPFQMLGSMDGVIKCLMAL